MSEKDAPRKKRLFIGTFLPEDDQQRLGALAQYKDRLSEAWHRRVRWVRPDKLHLTWVFLGHLDEALVPRLSEQLGAVLKQQRALHLTYDRPVMWPGLKQPRTFVLVPEAVPSQVTDLANRIKSALLDYTQRPEKRSYRPHVTLARLDPGKGSVQIPDWFPVGDLLPLGQNLDRVSIIESHLGSKTDGYEALETFILQ